MAPDPVLKFWNHMYRKFWRHVRPHIRASRPAWSEEERERTILTVWNAEPAVKQHYTTSDAENPALFALLPDEPSTEDEFVVARSHACYPHQVDMLPHVWPTQILDRTKQPVAPPIETQSAPYEHWPPLPWAEEPNLPDIGAGNVTLPKQEAFLDTNPHLAVDETRWHGAKWLGSGSYGAVGLWCEVDEQHNVVDRMVVKDNAAPRNRDAWRDPKNWRDRLPTEIAIHRRIESRRLAEPEAFQYIIKYRGHRLLMSKRRFRLYLDFASGGSIGAATVVYSQKWERIKRMDRFDKVETEDCLPEAFIWHIIKALATALLALENGTLGHDAVAGWKPIMHLDLQTPNILLDVQSKKPKTTAASSTHPSTQLIPRLADFGLATFDLDFTHCPTLAENPESHILPLQPNDSLTRYAPEHTRHDPRDPMRLDARTDVWGLGRIAWSLVVNTQDSHGPLCEPGAYLDELTGDALALSAHQETNRALLDRYEEEVLVGSREWPAARRYTDELKRLVRECLKFEKMDRPDAREVLERAERWLESNAEKASGAMDGAGGLLVLPRNDGLEVGELLVVRRLGTE